jgi:UDPglucose--hexose-1-phosphate uridylyltransferase
MSELRKDAILDRWVIIAPNRAARPYDLKVTAERPAGQSCPFCEGHEADTPGEVLAYREPGSRTDGPGWRLRVVPNKFPALEREPAARAGEGGREKREGRKKPPSNGPFPLPPSPFSLPSSSPALGAHEVVVESPRHVTSLSELSLEEVAGALHAYRQRFLDLKQDRRLVCAIAFKNVGIEAGASLEHTHSQLIALPFVPGHARAELSGSLTYFQQCGQCAWCAMIREELAARERIVFESADSVAFCPYASRVPYETWIVPKTHASHYEGADNATIAGIAGTIREVISRLEAVVDRPAYNYLIRSAPFDTQALLHYHWHIEVLPSLTKMAGFEWGTGCYINPVLPEQAAARLRLEL